MKERAALWRSHLDESIMPGPYQIMLLPRITLMATPSFLGDFLVRVKHLFFSRCD